MTTSTYGRPLSGAAGKDGPLTDQREKGCTGPTAKPGVAGAGTGRAGKSLDPGPRGGPPTELADQQFYQGSGVLIPR